MIDREARAREIMEAIGVVLHDDWDPIGIKDEPACQREYDPYIGGIYRLLASGASAEDLAKHLGQVEKDRMGLERTPSSSLMLVAAKLLRLDVRIGDGSAA